MAKTILILSDALRYDVAKDNMGFLGHLPGYRRSGHQQRWFARWNHPEQREVPLFTIQPKVKGRGDTGETVSHLQIAPTILSLLNVPIPETMKQPPLLPN